jgi:hypothetical protein
MISLLMPPPQYDFPYKGPLIEHVLPIEQVEPACAALGFVRPNKYVVVYGCKIFKNGICIIVIPAVNGWYINNQDQEMVRRHELAHCNGWPADHSGGGPQP